QLEVIDNEVTYKVGDCDIEYEGGTLTVRLAPRKILFRASFKSPVLNISSGLFFYNGIHVRVHPSGIYLLKITPAKDLKWQQGVSGCEAAFCRVGILIGRDSQGTGAAVMHSAQTRLIPTPDGGYREIDESELDPIDPSVL